MIPSDQAQRDRILHDLKTTLLVEAAAGAGKTTSLVGRMVHLVASGETTVDKLAAITFTRKAAGELRSRFQRDLEQAVKQAEDPDVRRRLRTATDHLHRCFISTVHAFCGRLLRERPVEAGVNPKFREADAALDETLRLNAWDRALETLHQQADDPLLDELFALGLNPTDIRDGFLTFANYPDVEQWPATLPERPDFERLAGTLIDQARRMQTLLASLTIPLREATCPLLHLYDRLSQRILNSRLEDLGTLFGVLQLCRPQKPTLKNWPDGNDQAREEEARWTDFCDALSPTTDYLLARRYAAAIGLYEKAKTIYDRLRVERGVLNFQDLLLAAARLLKDKPEIRRYFSRRYTHLLVDEFQDTDPIQAEMMLYLTADNPAETDWRNCRPRPGSLFIVGDPKQSIYRFRRADIRVYNQVRRIIENAGGSVLRLSCNFRTVKPILDWVNGCFEKRFASAPTDAVPQHVPMTAGRSDAPAGPTVQTIQHHGGRGTDWVVAEAEQIADVIAANIADGAAPGEFMILTWKKNHLGVYAAALSRRGLPVDVTGGAMLNQQEELELLTRCLNAVRMPHNPIALTAALRSRLFGVGDESLFAFRQAGGEFNFRSAVPKTLDESVGKPFRAAFALLKSFAGDLNRFPPAVAAERMITQLGLLFRAARGNDANAALGGLMKLLELIRACDRDTWNWDDLLSELQRRLEEDDSSAETIDARLAAEKGVRVMNLHKAKGLEAKIVFLADPSGKAAFAPDLAIDRAADATRGFMCIQQNRQPLAMPSDWRTLEKNEQVFANAEKDRLLYVAATRAKDKLVVSLREKYKNYNPWQTFEEDLGDASELPAAQPVDAPSPQTSESPPLPSAETIVHRWEPLLVPTYAVQAAKTLALAEAPPLEPTPGLQPPSDRLDAGADWGSAIHLMLEEVMEQPDANLDSLAADALQAFELPAELISQAAQTVRGILDSELWGRAQAAEECYVEAPFCYRLEENDPPTLVSGVIDLVFREPDGWVIADYKTDAAAETDPQSLAAHYRPQLELYAKVWETAAGQPVKEKLLVFTRTGQVAKLD